MIMRAMSLLLVLTLIGAGCALIPGFVKEYEVGYREKGVASWYGEPFHGRTTASGEIYDMYGMTAAHRMLPLGSRVRVVNLENGKTVAVRVTDRGPFVRGRILDLSFGAAKRLDMVQSGTVKVRLEVIETPHDRSGPFTVQVGSFSMERHARILSGKLRGLYHDVSVERNNIGGKDTYRVYVGRFESEKLARNTARKLKRQEGLEAFVIRQE